jgi:phosphatidylglycerophosphatase A
MKMTPKGGDGSLVPPIDRAVVTRWIVTGCCSGLASRAPGTAGSVAAVLAWLVAQSLLPFPHWASSFLLVILTVGAGFVAVRDYLQRHPDAEDPPFIVADEWAGMMLALLGTTPSAPVQILAAFLLFRILDIKKPWIIRNAETLPGAAGIMADDLLAGIATCLILIPWKVGLM